MITTLTLNPAFDIHVSINEFELYKENLADSVRKDVGGKGINISRALSENRIENTAIVICGEDNSEEFIDGLKSSGLDRFKTVDCPGRIRENITIHLHNGRETRLSFKGFSCTKAHLNQVESLIENSEYVTFTGSIPTGISSADACDFLLRLKSKGIKLIIDSKSIGLDILKRVKPWLIKPNEEEIFEYTGTSDINNLYNIALALNHDGIDNVIISLGKQGAILATDNNVYTATIPEISTVSTIGAGDSMIAGFISDNGTPVSRLRTAVSFGSAACLRPGTNPPLMKDIEQISRDIKIKSGIQA